MLGLWKKRRPVGFQEDALQGFLAPEKRLPQPEAWNPPRRGVPVRRSGAEPARKPHYWGHRERLRQRFYEANGVSLPDYEILELILFNAIPRVDVKPLAKILLEEFGDFNGVISAPAPRLLRIEGITEKVVIQFRLAEVIAARLARAKVLNRSVIASWTELMSYCKTVMAHRDTEQFRVLYLDRKNVLIADEAQAKGTIDHVPVYPREVAKRALEVNASAIILVHNHPSGDPTPSRVDIEMTERICNACEAVGVTVHDHVVIGKETDASFRELELI